MERYLESTGQQPLENLVPAIAEEAVGVDTVVLAIESQMDLAVRIFRRAGRLKRDLC